MATDLTVRASVLTHVGKRRAVNEDWYGCLEPGSNEDCERDGWLWVLADGVGAYGTGQEASSLAGEAILKAYPQTRDLDPADRLRQAVQAGNRALWERRRHYARQGQNRPVVTTVLLGGLLDGRLFLANVGDCRAYLARGGRLQQLTRDHTWVSEEVARGAMTPEEARSHARRNVLTRSLGQHREVAVDLFEHRLEPGDHLVLCTDGLTCHVEDREILQLATGDPVETATRAMVDLANARGGQDNITVAVVEVLLAAGRSARVMPPERSSPQPIPEPAAPPSSPESGTGARPCAPTSSTPTQDSALGTRHSAAGPASTDEAKSPANLPPAIAARPDYLATLHAIGQRISASLDLRGTLDTVIDSVVEATAGERGFIMLWDEAAGELMFSIGRNLGPEGRDAPQFSRNIVRSVYESGEPMLIGDAQADSRFDRYESVILHSLRSLMCAPLQVKGKRIGVVYVDNRAGAGVFSETDLALLCAFADQAAIALENARLYEQLKSQMAELTMMRTNQENVLRSINSAIISIDSSGRVQVFSPMAETIFGLSAEQARHRTLEDLLPPGVHRTLGALAGSQSVEPDVGPDEIQLETQLPHRGRVALSVKALPLIDTSNRGIGSVLVIEDLTQQRVLNEAWQREVTERERIKAVFGRYLAPSIVSQLMANPGSVQLGGVRCDITVLFADIRGFTGISERHSPEEVVAILNSYLAYVTEIIRDAGGTLDKFLGDGVMAFFNAPLPQEDHVLAAVRAGLEMQLRLRELQGPTGDRIAFGIGISTGEAIVGNIGTMEIMNYTAIGDAVNVAARLQGEARAGEVLLSASAYKEVAEFIESEELGSMHVKGRAEPVRIYKVRRLLP